MGALLLSQLLPPAILAFFYVYLFYALGLPAFVLNAVISLVLYFLIRKDLKDHDNQKYYLASGFLVAFFLIYSTTNVGATVLLLAKKAWLSILTVALFLLWGLAQVVALIYEFWKHKYGKEEDHKEH